VPNNVEEMDAAQKVQFSRQRSRDVNGPVLQTGRGSFGPGFMSGASERSQSATDAHIGSYDCNGAVSLHSVMQTNVPEPFSPKGKAPSHLNMPGGQWSQEDKYLAQDMQDAQAATNTPLPVRNTKSDKGNALNNILQNKQLTNQLCFQIYVSVHTHLGNFFFTSN
jgi:hypothetical protein